MRLLILTALLLSGCVTRGVDFANDTRWIEIGTTSKSEINRRLGQPFSVGQASGKPTWTYGYYHFQLFGSSYSRELKIYWDPNNIVSNFSYESNFPDEVQKKM